MTILESDRLLLRPPVPEDVPFFTEALADYEMTRQLATPPHPYTEADAEAFIDAVTKARAMGEGWTYIILTKATETPVGCCGVHIKDGRHELGYWIAKSYWGRGFATEAGHRLLAFAFGVVKAEVVEAGWFHDNPASGRVLARLGFEANHVESWPSQARGEMVLCNRAMLTRERFGRKKQSEASRLEAPALAS
jgi:[ribosomal protein S5]-alanine N-acetyltransferase